MKNSNIKIIKSTGEEEKFDKVKFCKSLKNAGTPTNVAQQVCDIVEADIKPGVTTSYLFRSALRQLVKHNIKVASDYNLRKGVAMLGPSGFLFEQYLEVLLRALGYRTLRNQMMQGKCVDHEIDVLAKKDNLHILVEAKYHNNTGMKTRVDVVMYAGARLRDIAAYQDKKELKKNIHKMWLFTNTKFTSKAIKYATCEDIMLTGWNYPKGNSLHDIIESRALYPVTVLPSMDAFSREQFAKYDMMLAQDLAPYSANDLIKKFKITKNKATRISKEAKALIYGEDISEFHPTEPKEVKK